MLVLSAVLVLSACGWLGAKKTPIPNPSEIIVTGAPAGSLLFLDGVQSGLAIPANDRTQVLEVAPGAHKIEIHVGDSVVYREDTFVGPAEHRSVRVLSGFSR